jgi:hypothetical protein
MRIPYFIPIAVITLALAGCGGKYVDDKHNFERAFRTACPKDIEVVHSIYLKSPHFTEEHEYYFEIKPAAGSDFLRWLTGTPIIIQSPNGLADVPLYFNLRPDRPEWFAPDSPTNYDTWYCTNEPFIILRDKQKAEIFVYVSVGM